MFFILLILFRALLDFSYFVFVNPVFGYQGFLLEFSPLTYLISWVFYGAALPCLTSRILRISDYFFMTFVLFVIAPTSSVYGLTDWGVTPFVAVLLSYFLFVLIVRSSWLKIPVMPVVIGGDKLAIAISAGITIFVLSWYFLSGARFNLDLSKVYEFRAENAELASLGFFSYLNNWAYKVFSIFFISYFLFKKKWVFVLLGMAAQIAFYGFSAHKSVLFSLFLVFGIWFLFNRTNKSYIFPLGLMALLSICLLVYIFFDHVMLGSLLIRRVFYIPAYLTYKYFEFFSVNPLVYWSNSFLSGVIQYPYDVSVPKTVGLYIGTGDSANNGYVSMGYAHFGYLGVVIYTVIFALILRFFDVAARKIGSLWFGLVISVVPLRGALISSDLLTTLLTHGLLLSICLMVLIRRRQAYVN